LSSGASEPPSRDGVNASTVGLPAGPWPTLIDFLTERFANVPRATWLVRAARGDLTLHTGQRVTVEFATHAPYPAQGRLYYYRDVPDEPAIPFQEDVLYQDEHLLVVDKPHFVPVVPSGHYLQQTLLVRLRRRLGLPHLAPIHRLDRDTAGLVLFSCQPATRDAYCALFRQHQVHKTYHAVAGWRPELHWPLTRQSRIVPAGHFMLQHEVPGPVNAITHIDLLRVHDALALYQLRPVTGQRHQLRVHMLALGLPILNDGLYPVLTPQGSPDITRPLQLLARELHFTDPLTRQPRHFVSTRRLRMSV